MNAISPKPASAAQSAQGMNSQISALIRSVSTEVVQQIYSATISSPGSSQNQINVPLANVGLAKGFVVEVTATLANSGTAAASIADFGAANILSGIQFTDLDNYQRINTTGLHIAMLNALKEGWPFGAALLSSALDTPMAFGNNSGGNVISASSTIAASGTGTVTMKYWVPLAYSKQDLRGAVFMGVVNATAYLGLTINPAPGVTTGDNTLAVYSGANTGVTISSATIRVYQVYLDQLPRYSSGANAGKPILPPIDISTQYRLVNTSLQGVTANQDFPIPFTNFQQFLSLCLIYDQAGTRNGGSDINYFALTTANTYTLFKVDPYLQLLKQRLRIKADFPKGFYAFDFRDAPIDTNQAGNMQLLLNAITAATGTTVMAYFESFALVQAVLGAQSLPAS
jgi:hypothetical protein